MDNLRKHKFLERVRNALADDTRRQSDFYTLFPSTNRENLLRKIKARTKEDRLALLNRLKETAVPLNLDVVPVNNREVLARSFTERVLGSVPEWGSERRVVAWDHELIESLDLESVLRDHGVPIYVTRPPDPTNDGSHRKEVRREINAAYIGVTSADFCVADTATVVIKNRPGHARSVSLVPSIHVVVIKLDQLIENLSELYCLLKSDPSYPILGLTNCMTFISGPSKTADIEIIMVHGAHGPREMVIYVITG